MFYVVLAGDDKATGVGRATGCGRKLKAPSLQTKSTINEGPPENMGFNGKKISDKKKQNTLQAVTKQPRGTHGLNAATEDRPKYTSSSDQTTPWNTRSLNAAKLRRNL